ncbi:hypothetical protein EDWATA_00683 [Edwardsiella tarda ATCC 23685]|uniref:Uncharacterized protein n=1 Tax=Edwardsiella tarda ATCC 23685 TaxID=500638 RepID=D4F1T9_EDWTA|nr:hypothetical protein EDWATA_00683 [Edwardsiella tarda ATCC 23685]
MWYALGSHAISLGSPPSAGRSRQTLVLATAQETKKPHDRGHAV